LSLDGPAAESYEVQSRSRKAGPDCGDRGARAQRTRAQKD